MWYLPEENKLFTLHSEIRQHFNTFSFPEEITESDIEFVGLKGVQVEPLPTYDEFNYKVQSTVTHNDVLDRYFYTHQVIEMQQDEKDLYRKSKVPQVVFMRQARLALLEVNLLDTIEETINLLPEPSKSEARIEWEYASEIRRDWPTLQSIVQFLELTEEYIDDLFILAATK